eukprot:3242271-Prorocentrum_lima.AAC.1
MNVFTVAVDAKFRGRVKVDHLQWRIPGGDTRDHLPHFFVMPCFLVGGCACLEVAPRWGFPG